MRAEATARPRFFRPVFFVLTVLVGLGAGCRSNFTPPVADTGPGRPGDAGTLPRTDDAGQRDGAPSSDSGTMGTPRSCAEILAVDATAADGLYEIDVDGTAPLAPFTVFCDMTTDDGGWTLVMRGEEASSAGTAWATRTDGIGSVSSDRRSWSTYKLPDATINAIPRSTFRALTDGYLASSRFWSGTCQFAQDRPASDACVTCFQDRDLALPIPLVDPSRRPALLGMACETGLLATAHPGAGGEFVMWSASPAPATMDAGDGTWGCDGQPGVHRPEMANTGDCNFTLWVR